ncbi:MAG TPA: ATP-NAD kinase family protein [Pseudomonadales bacterium]|nr:ATP-NAD kinase family protein [Pseudomonadales bacterium]
MLRLGLLVNPLAGLGGPTALKGSDGVAEVALARGASAAAGERAARALACLAARREDIRLLTWGGAMGEDAARAAGFAPTVLGRARTDPSTADDSRRAVQALAAAGCDLILFAGGDGTARDLVAALGDARQPVLGIPAGVKMHSGVYGVNPEAAARVVLQMLDGELVAYGPADVRDIDEDGYRAGRVRARHFGELQVPAEPRWVQQTKVGGRESEPLVLEELGAWVAEQMDASDGALWLVGPGSTTAAVMAHLGLDNTLLGVDVVRDRALVASDVTAADLERLLGGADAPVAHMLLTVIGGQGHLFGRGNQQFSPAVIRAVGRERIHVVATRSKLVELEGRPLRLDTGDAELDRMLAGFIPVLTGYEDEVLYPVGEPVPS